MKMLGTIKNNIGEFVLRKQKKQLNRKISSINLNNAKNIGILFDATDVVSFEVIKGFEKQISTGNNSISVLGYVDNKQMIDHYLLRKGYEFFTRTNLNWFFKPEGEAVENFINAKFDLLIDLNLEENYPMKYILSLSKASFKVGRYTESHNLLDFMIDIESEKEAMKDIKNEINKGKSPSHGKTGYDNVANRKTDVELQLNFLINQLVHYLSKLKN